MSSEQVSSEQVSSEQVSSEQVSSSEYNIQTISCRRCNGPHWTLSCPMVCLKCHGDISGNYVSLKCSHFFHIKCLVENSPNCCSSFICLECDQPTLTAEENDFVQANREVISRQKWEEEREKKRARLRSPELANDIKIIKKNIRQCLSIRNAFRMKTKQIKRNFRELYKPLSDQITAARKKGIQELKKSDEWKQGLRAKRIFSKLRRDFDAKYTDLTFSDLSLAFPGMRNCWSEYSFFRISQWQLLRTFRL